MYYEDCVYHYCVGFGDEIYDRCELSGTMCRAAYGEQCEDMEEEE